MRRKTIIRAKGKPVIKLNLPPRYDQKILDQIKEMKEYPQVQPMVTGDKGIQVVNDRLTKEKFIIKQAGLLYDFQNPVQTEADIKQATQDMKPYSDDELKEAFGIDEDISSEYSSVYKSSQNWKFLEALRLNGPYSNTVENTLDFVTGIDYSHLQTDVNDTFPDTDMKSIELEKINNNFLVYSLKNELEEIDRVVGLRHKILSLMVNKRTFGRAAEMIVLNENTLLPEAIEILFPMMLGRVFYTTRTKKIVGIEYDDPENKLIPATKLIYAVNRDYGQSPASLFYGYSDVEYFQPLIETDFIIDTYDLKEINRSQYVGKKIVQIMDKDDNTVTVMRKSLENSDLVVTKHATDVKDLNSNHEGAFLVDERLKNEDKITNDLGMPSVLTGRSTSGSGTYAETATVMQAFQETKVKKLRMEVRETYEDLYYNRNLKQLVKNRLDFLNSVKNKYAGNERDSDVILQELLFITKNENLTQAEIEQKDLLKQELKMQRDRENWEKYRELFFKKRLDIIKQSIFSNVSVDKVQAEDLFQQIKKKVEDNQSFEIEDLGQIDTESENDTVKLKAKPATDTIPPKPVTTEPQDNPNADMQEGDDSEETEGWNDTTVPSPCTIDFEIAELEKLLVLEPHEYPFKFKMQFKDVSIVTKLENTAAIISKKKENIINLDDARNELGYEDVVSRESLKENLDRMVQDILKKFIKPAIQEPQNFQEIVPPQGMMPGDMVPPQDNEGLDQQKQNTDGKTLGINIQQRMKNQTDRTPTVRIDKTSVKKG